ncbi:MAG: OsmC family protein [Candidatus Rokubacteria bacterium]|nr:OsmC family protein [Candidatus Rokubacteria bacterium]
MKPLPHRYDVLLAAGATGYATLTTPGAPDLRAAPPVDFDGPGDAWSPEALLLAAVATCFLFTLRAVARASRIDFASLELAVAGTVNMQDGVMRFTEIVLRPRLSVPPGVDRDRTLRVLEKSERTCLVSASLSTPIRLAPEIVTG